MRRPAAIFTIALTLGAIILATAPGALAATTIGNTPPWPGCCSGSLSSGFGVTGAPSYFTPTYGQTVTVPSTDTKLDSFTFYVDLPTNLLFRGEAPTVTCSRASHCRKCADRDACSPPARAGSFYAAEKTLAAMSALHVDSR